MQNVTAIPSSSLQMAVLSRVAGEVMLDVHGVPIYQPVEVMCDKGKIKLWRIEEHKLAVDFMKKQLQVYPLQRIVLICSTLERRNTHLRSRVRKRHHIGWNSLKFLIQRKTLFALLVSTVSGQHLIQTTTAFRHRRWALISGNVRYSKDARQNQLLIK